MKRRAYSLASLLLLAGAVFLLPTSQADTNSSKSAAGKNVTFSKDVAPIFFKNCAECHRPGEASPFSVLSYKDVRPWAKSIREKVVNRTMPPWHADPHVGQWANDRRLSPAEIATISTWVEGGAKEGNAKDLPPVPQFADGWAIGKPDLIIPMPEAYTLAASGPDEYQYFEVDPGFTEDKYVQMAEARPDNRKIVHHIIAFIVPPSKDARPRPNLSKEELQKLRARMEKESIFYRDGFLQRVKMDAPVYNDGCAIPESARRGRSSEEAGTLLCGYAPGMNQAIWEPGTVKKIPAGAKIMFQMHYSKVAGSEQKDRSSIGLIFAKTPPQKQLFTRGISNNHFMIPPGTDNFPVTACWTTPDDIHIVTFMPHLHLRGKSQKIEAFLPDGGKQVLLNVPEYDFSWQTVYYAQKPVALPKGTKILVTSTFDNSTKNKYNPDPTKAVRWGDPTYDEMMIGWIDYTIDNQLLPKTTAMKQ